MQDLRAIILAAGKGTRMKSEIPKVLHEVCGRSIIQYVLDIVRSVGSLKNYIVLGHKAKVVEDFLGNGFIFVEQKKLLGTADAVRCTEKVLKGYKGDVLILCGDTPLLNKGDIKKLIVKHRKSQAAVTFLTADVDVSQGYGRIIRDHQGNPEAIREEKDASKEEKNINEINVGVYCFQASKLFDALKKIKLNSKKKEFYLTDIIALFANKGWTIKTIKALDSLDGLGINSKEDLAVAESIIRQKILKDFMQKGITIIDPNTTYIDADVTIGQDTVVRPFTFIEKDVKIGENCSIGPFARLRSGARLGSNVAVGNFTEISRSQVGDNTCMKHFSYLGDAVIGTNVNIGAGAITANFDGKNKNITKIDQGSFIGSGSVLVAPVSVGKKVVIGAGSVVTRGTKIPSGQVAFGVPAKIKKGK